jgi:hypothetical protein
MQDNNSVGGEASGAGGFGSSSNRIPPSVNQGRAEISNI